jgi:hypothetical protein
MAFLFMSMTGKLRNISTARDCPASAVVQASPLLWQTAPGEQTSPGDHGVQFNVKIADLLRRRMRQEAAAFWAATLITESPR